MCAKKEYIVAKVYILMLNTDATSLCIHTGCLFLQQHVLRNSRVSVTVSQAPAGLLAGFFREDITCWWIGELHGRATSQGGKKWSVTKGGRIDSLESERKWGVKDMGLPSWDLFYYVADDLWTCASIDDSFRQYNHEASTVKTYITTTHVP